MAVFQVRSKHCSSDSYVDSIGTLALQSYQRSNCALRVCHFAGAFHGIKFGVGVFLSRRCKAGAMEFRVIWEIDIDADNPAAAAQEARALQLKMNTSATIFDIWEPAAGEMHRIDVAWDTERLEHAELGEVRAALRLLLCERDVPPSIRDVAVTMLIFLDRENMMFRRYRSLYQVQRALGEAHRT